MTNQEINEFLAEHLFGLSRIHDGLWAGKINDTTHAVVDLPDYIANWQVVVEKFVAKFVACLIYGNCDLRYAGKTIGEAICRAAVEYLKIKEGK